MDFGDILYAAHKNEKSANKEVKVKCYSTKFEPPKKEIKTKANLSANIQKYLQKRDDEERHKAEKEQRKKEELLLLRSQDKKSFKRVQTMLKRTKSANKSVMEDAVDDVNTAVTMEGPQQCDDDDYGYVSQEASAFYAKMMDKYQSMPDEPKFPKAKKPVVKDLNAAKDRVRAALLKEEEEEMMPHKRKRKSKSETPKDEEEGGKYEDDRRRYSPPPEERKSKKPPKMAPPPMDFSALLKLAEKKQFEPVQLEKKVKYEEDNGVRPMTKKEKMEYQREQEWKERKMARENAMKNGSIKTESLPRIPKVTTNINNNEEKREKPNGFGRIPKKINTEIKPEIDRKNEVRKPESAGRPNSDSSKGSNLSRNEQSRSSSNSYDTNRSKEGRSSYEPQNRHGRSNEISSEQLSKVSSSIGRGSYDRQRISHQSKENSSSSKDRKISEVSRARERSASDDERYGSNSEKIHSSYQSNERSNYSKTTKNSSSHYEREREKSRMPPERRIAHNKITSRKHSLSDNEQSNASDFENERSDESERNFKSERQSSNHDRGRERDRNNYDRKEIPSRSKEQKPYRSNDNSSSNKSRSQNHSVSEGESDTSDIENRREQQRKYSTSDRRGSSSNQQSSRNKLPDNYTEKKTVHPRNYNSDRSQPERENQQFSAKRKYSDSPTPEHRSDKERSSFSQSKKPRESSNYNRSHVSHRERSASPEVSRYRRKEHSDSEPEDDDKYVPRMVPPKRIDKPTEKKKERLFEGSDKESHKKQPSHNNNGSQRSNEATFKTPKPVSRQESSRSSSTEKIDKYRAVEKERPSSSSMNRPGPKCSKPDSYTATSKTTLEKPRPSSSTEKPRPPSDPTRKPSSSGSTKKPELLNPETALKKGSDVWSKPCNASPSPAPARPSSGLSESQIQRLREMNKKPTLPKPIGDRLRTALGRPTSAENPAPRDERRPDGRPLPTRPAEKATSSKPAQSRSESQSGMSDRSKPSGSSTKPSSSSSNSKSREVPKDSKPRQFPPADLKPKQFPPSDLKPRQFPPKDVRSRQFPPADVKRRPKPGRIESDSEDEYDSEMDDFIEDGTNMDQEQILEEIRNIFGYDKSKYAGMDDDEVEESNFGRIDQEELNSLRIGLVEDYEDMKMEQMEKKRKMQKKMALKNRR